MKKILFIDRDGCIIEEPEDEQIDSFAKLRFLPGVIGNLKKLRRETDYLFVMVTNQDGLGTRSHPEENFWPVHNFIMQTLADEGVEFDEVHIDSHRPEDENPNRKPGTGMITHFMKGGYDLANSYVIGDRLSDVQLAANIGCQAIRIGEQVDGAKFCANSWDEIYNHIIGMGRRALVERKTSETDIRVALNLDGRGIGKINTGLGFYDHMLEQLSRHGGVDLEIEVKGDLHIDEHHTIEDTALALGQAFREALGTKKGLARYGFLLPMDDSLAKVAIDFGGRPWLEWDVKFKREKI
ncbi:MAG TPA: histidinol-phosphatase, partial [Cryomorphaceae bacterium]|nr:histidinol-phosphatase [Cryomorphaceae bacterium]